MPTISSSGQQSIDTLLWLGWADQDYIAARVLLPSGLLVQGAVLAATAIEKYLKAVCTLASIPFGGVDHDVSKLNGLLYRQNIRLGLRVDFLRFLTRAYKLRYPDDLSPGFNTALNSTATLVETDLAVQRIRQGFVFRHTEGRRIVTRQDEMLGSRKPELLTRNCALGGATKAELFSERSWSYDLRVLDNREVMECFYVVERLLDDNNFRRKGLAPVPGSEGRSFTLAWQPTADDPRDNHAISNQAPADNQRPTTD